MKLLQEECTSTLGLPAGTFIYNVTHLHLGGSGPVGDLLFVASSSNDALTVFFVTRSRSTYEIKVHNSIENAHTGLSCLQTTRLNSVNASSLGKSVISAGRDAIIRIWTLTDKYELSEALQLQAPSDTRLQGFSAIAQSGPNDLVAAGTELETDGPGDVSIYIWKVQRSSKSQYPILAFKESHTDTITNLSFQPSNQPNGLAEVSPVDLVSSSTDGLVNIFDLQQHDEDDAVLAVVNTRSAVQYMLCAAIAENRFSETGIIWTISQDEKLALHRLLEIDADGSDQQQKQLEGPADLRETLSCDYTISLQRFNQEAGNAILAVGGYKSDTAEEPRVDLYLLHGPHMSPGSEPELRLVGAHGEEIVRDVWYSEDSSLIVTCGEDSQVRIWREANAGPRNFKAAGERVRETKKKAQRPKDASDARFRPY